MPFGLLTVEEIVRINQLTKQYSSITAVNGLNLSIPKGSVYGILGPNGSGKTTTLGMLLGVIRPSSGYFTWFGKTLNFSAKKKVGALLETPNFYPYLSGRKNLEIVSSIKEIEKPDIDGILKHVNLYQRAVSKFKTYSLGMKQRLAIASAMIANPEVMVLDEPTNGLDPEGIAEVRAIIRNIAAQGITVIMASHLLDEIEKVCSHVAVLREGNLLFDGTVDQLTGREGTIEIGAQNIALLKDVLQGHPLVEKISDNTNGTLTLVLRKNTDASEITRFLAEKSIYVNHLVFRKNSLESQFLNLIKNEA